MNINPFDWDYKESGHLTLLLRVKMLWRTLKPVGLDVQVAFATIGIPQQNDKLITILLLREGVYGEIFCGMNRCCLVLQMLFLLDLVLAIFGRYWLSVSPKPMPK